LPGVLDTGKIRSVFWKVASGLLLTAEFAFGFVLQSLPLRGQAFSLYLHYCSKKVFSQMVNRIFFGKIRKNEEIFTFLPPIVGNM
jgi:hypothetical protein